MHIGFLALDYPSAVEGGGVGDQVRILARALVHSGHRATVIALAGRELPLASDDLGVKVYRVKPGNVHWYASKAPLIGSMVAPAIRELEYGRAAWSLIQKLHELEPFDLLEGTETGAVIAAFAETSIPMVIRLHGEVYSFCKYTPATPLTAGVRLARVLQRMALRRSKMLISPSQSHAREISAELRGKHPPIQIIPNVLSPSHCTRKSEVTDSERPMVLFAGRLEQRKGIPTLLAAAARILQTVPGTQFVLAGAYHPTLPEKTLRELITRFKLNGQVKLLGHTPTEQMAKWYQRATVCVLPSYYETFGLTALEPMIHGTPVVASSTSALPEVVRHRRNGLLVLPGDSTALAEALLEVCQNRNLRERLSQQAQEWARRFDVDRWFPETLKLYGWAASSGLRRRPRRGALLLLSALRRCGALLRRVGRFPCVKGSQGHGSNGVRRDVTNPRLCLRPTSPRQMGHFPSGPHSRRQKGHASFGNVPFGDLGLHGCGLALGREGKADVRLLRRVERSPRCRRRRLR